MRNCLRLKEIKEMTTNVRHNFRYPFVTEDFMGTTGETYRICGFDDDNVSL